MFGLDKKYKFIVLSAILLSGIFSSYTILEENLFEQKYYKKIVKQIHKTFGKEEFEYSLINNDSLLLNNKELYEIKQGTELKGYFMLSYATACKKGGCVSDNQSEEYDDFYFVTLYDVNKYIKNIRVLEYNSINGYQITAASWLKQFINKKGGSLKVNKDIDAISGATISVNSIVNQINTQQHLLE